MEREVPPLSEEDPSEESDPSEGLDMEHEEVPLLSEEDPSEESDPSEGLDMEHEEVPPLSEEDPLEDDLSEESDIELEEVAPPALPALLVGPAPPRCPICGIPGHVQQECHTFGCLECDEPRGRPHPICFACDPFVMFEFDGVCDACSSAWATAGMLCADCDQVRIAYLAALPPAEPGTPPLDQPEWHAGFDLNLPPPEEESSDED